ncbi:DUF3992 domain-containing protein [Mycoplasmatota bacterium zrk1]
MRKHELKFDFKVKESKKQTFWSCDKSITESSGTMIVHYSDGPCKIDISVNGTKEPIKTLSPGESYSKTCSLLKSVEITPKGKSSRDKACCGSIGLIINHEVHTKIKKSKDFPLLFILFILLALLPFSYFNNQKYPSNCL